MSTMQSISPKFPFESHYVDIYGSQMHYIDVSTGDPIVFLHGNPTSSYLWRNVIPRLAGEGRLLAPDLIGMGRSGRPDIPYLLSDHERYLDAWFDALGLDRVTLILPDWGTALGISWARRHEARGRGIALMEAIVRSNEWEELDSGRSDTVISDLFRAFRTPSIGEKIILQENAFVEQVLPGSTVRKLTDEEMAAYRAPFPTPESRLAVLAFPLQLPIVNEPASTMEIIDANGRWLATSDVPKLLFTFDPGVLITPALADWARSTFRNLEVEHIGPGIHYVPEDQPEAIGDHVKAWRQRVGIAG